MVVVSVRECNVVWGCGVESSCLFVLFVSVPPVVVRRDGRHVGPASSHMIAAAGCRRLLPPSWSWSVRDRVWDAQAVRCGVGGGVVLYGVVLGGVGWWSCLFGSAMWCVGVVLRVVVCLCCLFVFRPSSSGVMVVTWDPHHHI